MKRWMLFLIALLFSVTPAIAQQTPAQQRVTPPPGEIPQIVAFDKEGLLGDHIHIFGNTTDLGKWDNSISSMVILSGRWEFFDDEHFKGERMGELGPGMYLTVKDHGLKDNRIALPTAFSKKWTFDLPMHRVVSGRYVFEANANRFALSPQIHCTKPFDNLRQEASIRQR